VQYIKKIYFLPAIVTQWIIRLITRPLFLFFCNLKIRGLENLDRYRGPLIFVPNHASEWDGPLVRAVMPMRSRFGPMFYAGMDGKFYRAKRFGLRGYLIYGNPLFKLFGAYPVYYGLNNYEKSLKNLIRILECGGSVTIFPEGGLSKTGEIKDFKVGAIALAHLTNVPIVPVFIKDTYSLSRNEFLSRKRNVTINFGTPYMINIPKQESGDQLLNTYKEKIAELRQAVVNLSK